MWVVLNQLSRLNHVKETPTQFNHKPVPSKELG